MRVQHHLFRADAACGLAGYCGRWCQTQYLGPEVPVPPLHRGQLSEECHSALRVVPTQCCEQSCRPIVTGRGGLVIHVYL